MAPVAIPGEVFQSIKTALDNREAVLAERYRIRVLAERRGHAAAAAWIRDNPDLYRQGVTEGFCTAGTDEVLTLRLWVPPPPDPAMLAMETLQEEERRDNPQRPGSRPARREETAWFK